MEGLLRPRAEQDARKPGAILLPPDASKEGHV